MEKREIARCEQFLLLPLCFQNTCSIDMLKPALVRERLNSNHIKAISLLKEWQERRKQ